MSQQEQNLEQTAILAEDELLRQWGHPQQHLYAFRAAGLTYSTMALLPPPWLDDHGNVPDSYWQFLQEWGIPSEAFPTTAAERHRPARRDQELRTFASQVVRYSAASDRPAATASGTSSFEARFGSPVRHLNFDVPATPRSMAQTNESRNTSSLLSMARRAAPTPVSQPITSPTQDGSTTATAPTSDTAFCDHIDFVLDPTTWHRLRSDLISSSQCLVLSAFALNDKQFQSALLSAKVPESIRNVGTREFDLDAWRDLKEWFETLDVWNLYCALHCTNFRAILDNTESISMGGNEMARALREVPTFKFLGHSELTTGLTQWHAQHVLQAPTLLFASLASVVLRDRAIRPLILSKINPSAKQYIRSSFVHDTGLFVTHVAALHSWRFKAEDTWTALFELNKALAGKKPRGMSVRDWRLRLDRWRVQRRSLAKSDIDSDIEHIWMMRCLESFSDEPWYKHFRKTMASNEHNGIYVKSVEEMWEKLENEETWQDGFDGTSSSAQSRVNALSYDSATEGKRSHTEHSSADRANRFARNVSVAALGGKGRGRGLGRGRNDERDARRPGAPRTRDGLPGDSDARPGARKWGLIGFAKDHPNPAPNPYGWSCRTCKSNPCRGFCKVCLQTCAHQADHSSKNDCPYVNGTRTVMSWDFTRPCIKCSTPRADHQPWKCPSDRVVHITNRHHPPKILVDYPAESRKNRRVMHINVDGEDGEHHDEEHPDDESTPDDNELICAHIAAFVDENIENQQDDAARPPTPASPAAQLDAPQVCSATTDDSLGKRIREAVDALYKEGSDPIVNVVTYYIASVRKHLNLSGAVLLDTGAQCNIENDITCFVGYLEPSDVKIGLAEKNTQLRNCGYGLRERRYRDHTEQVYVVQDHAYYCPDAAYPIMCSGDWEERDASVLLNPGKRFRKTEAGTRLPEDSASALIIDKNERILVLHQVPGCPRLHWLFTIKPTSVQDVERNSILQGNRRHVSNLLSSAAALQTELDARTDGPSVEEYASKIKAIESALEEAHLLHSRIYGAARQAEKAHIMAAHTEIQGLQPGANHDDFADAAHADRKRARDRSSDVVPVCAKCHGPHCCADVCIHECVMCEHPTGHYPDCPYIRQGPSRQRRLVERSEPSTSGTHNQHETIEAHRLPQPTSSSRSLRLDKSEVGAACASLDVVRTAVDTRLQDDEDADEQAAILEAVVDIAARGNPQQWQDARELVAQVELHRTPGHGRAHVPGSPSSPSPSADRDADDTSPQADQPSRGSPSPSSSTSVSVITLPVEDQQEGVVREVVYDQALQHVVADYAWHHVVNNISFLPHVGDLHPNEWTQALTTQERALLAHVFMRFDEAAQRLENIDPDTNLSDSEQSAVIHQYMAARERLDKTVSEVVALVTNTMHDAYHMERPYDPGWPPDHKCQHQMRTHESLQVLQNVLAVHHVDAPAVRRRKCRRKVIDICSGQQSLARMLLLLDAGAEILSIDIISKEEALAETPSHLWHRIHYIQLDIYAAPLTVTRLRELVTLHLRCGLQDLYHVHFSPCCKSYSTAQGKHNTRSYRLPDGSPNPKVGMIEGKRNEAMFRYAHMWDDIVSTTLHTFVQLASLHPRILITAENPVGAWCLHPSVQKMQNTQDWRLLEVDYCKTTDPQYDADRVFTQKPTHILAFGVREASVFSLPKCQRDCPFMLRNRDGITRFHARAIRIDATSPPGQTRQIGSMRHAIPAGLFARIYDEHERWLVSRLPAANSVVVLSSRIQPDTITTARSLEHNHGRKPPLVPSSHQQAYTSELTRLQKLYLLLHFRFGHASLKRLQALTPYAKILTKAHKVECPVCHAAKATKKPHVGKLTRMAYALALVVFDIQGPFRIPDIDGNLYNLVLVDDHTDFKWLYRLRSKDQLGVTLRAWMAMLGVCPERLRHDGAGENLGQNGINSVAQVCYERCIFPERTVPHNPQQLTRVERVNRTFLEAARCLLLTTPGATDDLWGYAFMHACYLDQFLGSDSLSSCPYKRWHGSDPPQPLLNSIRTWGSIVVFTHNEDRHKLQMPGHRGMFLGYSSVSDGVYIRDLDNERKPVRITRDVLSRSFSEVAHLVREPVGVTLDEFQLLENEATHADSGRIHPISWESILLTNCEPVAHDLHQYYKSFQAFAKDRRMLLSQDASRSPQSVESSIKEDWRKMQVTRAQAEHSRRQHEQVMDDVRRTVQRRASRALTSSTPEQPRSAITSDVSEKVDPHPRRSKRLAVEPSSSTSTIPLAKPQQHELEASDEPASNALTFPQNTSQRASKFANSSIDDIPCEMCGDPHPHAYSPMIICDGCNKGFHTRCAKISVMPAKDHDWLCHKCIQPGMRIAVFHKRDKQWHNGTVRAQHAQAIGTEVAYDNGSRALENLNAVKWRPLYEDNIIASLVALAESQPHEDLSNLNIWIATTPRSLAHLRRFPARVQELWHQSRLKEFKSIVAKEAVEIVDVAKLPANAIVLPAAWVFKVKGDGTLKSRLVLLGHLMPKSDEIDVSSPTPRLASLRLILAIAIKLDLAVEVADIDTAFTYASPATTIYATIPEGLYDDGRLKGKYMHLLKNLYGAAEAPRMFHNLLHNWFVADGFSVNPHEPCLYTRWHEHTPLFALVHVDDCILVGLQNRIDALKARIKTTFSLKELGPLGLDSSGAPSVILGVEVTRTADEFQLRQTKLIDSLVEKAGNDIHNIPHEKVPIRDLRLDSSSSPQSAEEKSKWRSRPFRSLLGIVGYLMMATRMDCAFAYQALARFNDSYGEDHWSALMCLVMYLKKSKNTFYLSISKHGGVRLCGYCDADWNGSEFCKSSTGWIIFFGSTPISWVSRLQRVTARSTGEAEFYALSSLAQEAVYLQMFVGSLHIPASVLEIFSNDKSRYQTDSSKPAHLFDTAVKIWSDSKVALAQAAKPDHWIVDKLRHIRTAYFFFKSYVRSAKLELCSCSGNDNPADIFTKGFGTPGKTAANQKADLFQRHALFCSGRPV